MASTESCYHCALPVPAGVHLSVDLDGKRRPVCCPGCKAVAELIRDSGLANYYGSRDTPRPGAGRPEEDGAEWRAYNSAELQSAFAPQSDGVAEAIVYAGGMYCAACSWLIENGLRRLDGVQSVDVNPLTHRVRVSFQGDRLGLGDVLAQVAALGYQPQPLSRDNDARPEVIEQRSALKRLLVASLGMMQVMMFAVALYAGEFQGIDADMQRFLRLISFLVTTPVVFYSARPFFTSAWRGLSAGRPGMDLPVSIAIGAAYLASVYSTFSAGEAVWFDSVTMFVFFLSVGRYLEMQARHRSIDHGAALAKLIPNTAIRLQGSDREVVAVDRLTVGDVVVLRTGDAVPADGVVVAGDALLDESLLTGESESLQRTAGSRLTAGSVVSDGQLEMRVHATGADTALSAIARLSERARFARPAFVQLADRIASRFVLALLLVATVVAIYWALRAPERAFVITLSVLVVTCPCALALATPAAFAAAGSRLAQLRLLLTNGEAIESLARATDIVFDKTGTLTTGRPRLTGVDVLDEQYSSEDCLAIAAALEQQSSHPIASAFLTDEDTPDVDGGQVHIGRGVSGRIAGVEWRLGKPEFAGGDELRAADFTTIVLAGDGNVVARFELRDALRAATAETIEDLRALGLSLSLASGDKPAVVERVAASLAIEDAKSSCTPEEKLSFIRDLQAVNKRVVMIGDGINDGPVLAGADVSVAPVDGAQLAQARADVVMLGESLRPLATAIRMSRATLRIVRQNLAWAIVYNLTALPLAAAGFVPPWAAAIGMSASSLIVVLNSLRLSRYT